MKPILEIACFNPQSALHASTASANRIELCKDAHLGGTTPLLSTFRTLKSQLSIPIYVMIRPRGFDFVYSDSEFEQMLQDIQLYKDHGADGFVFGILDSAGKVDAVRNSNLVEKAGGRPCTFHRAFDEISPREMGRELEVVVKCGFSALLTSGGEGNAVDGKERLKMLVEAAAGRIEIIVGGGVRSFNIERLRETGAGVFHSSALVGGDAGEVASIEEVRLLKEVLMR